MDIGSVIKEQYKVIEHIGRGGMADVWSARDTRLRRLVAIKTIAKGLSADVDPVALFEKEAQTIAAMEHPHICLSMTLANMRAASILSCAS
jgi:eukaryotic-like serine/threonine-protein kinase